MDRQSGGGGQQSASYSQIHPCQIDNVIKDFKFTLDMPHLTYWQEAGLQLRECGDALWSLDWASAFHRNINNELNSTLKVLSHYADSLAGTARQTESLVWK